MHYLSIVYPPHYICDIMRELKPDIRVRNPRKALVSNVLSIVVIGEKIEHVLCVDVLADKKGNPMMLDAGIVWLEVSVSYNLCHDLSASSVKLSDASCVPTLL